MTCKKWYEISRQIVRIVDLRQPHNIDVKATAELFQTIYSRFPNVTRVIAMWVLLTPEEVLSHLKSCKQLELLSIGETYHKTLDDVELFLADFPNYRAISTHSTKPIDEQVTKRVLSAAKITHLRLSSGSLLESLVNLDVTTDNVTSLVIDKLEDNILRQYFNMCGDRLKNLTHVRISMMSTDTFKMLIQNTPKLTHFSGTLESEQIKILIENCPLLENINVHCRNMSAEDFRAIANQKNIKVFATDNFVCALTNPSNLEEIHCRSADEIKLNDEEDIDYDYVRQSLPHLRMLKRMHLSVQYDLIPDVIKYCPRLEQISVDAGVKSVNIKNLVVGCPKLRYIIGASMRMKVPRIGNVIDAMRMRESVPVVRPKKKAKK